MQADKITKKILEEASAMASSILEDAESQSKLMQNKADDFVLTQKKEVETKIENFKTSVEEKYNTLLKIEGNKILLKSKQDILNRVKETALNNLVNLSKQESLKFLTSLIKKYASKGETLYFSFKNINQQDILDLPCVKELNLNVKKANFDETGIILSNENCDKNLLFNTLIETAFEEKEDEINKILF